MFIALFRGSVVRPTRPWPSLCFGKFALRTAKNKPKRAQVRFRTTWEPFRNLGPFRAASGVVKVRASDVGNPQQYAASRDVSGECRDSGVFLSRLWGCLSTRKTNRFGDGKKREQFSVDSSVDWVV